MTTTTDIPILWEMFRTLAIVAMLATTANADPWTATDTAIEVVNLAAIGAHYVQVQHEADAGVAPNTLMGVCGTTPDGCRKIHPSIAFLGIATLHVVVARALPAPWRSIFQGATLVVEVRAVSTNWSAGYAVEF